MKDVLDSIKWPGALVVLGVLGLVAYLFSKGATLEALLAVAVGLMGYQQQQRAQDSQRLQQVEANTNGVNTGLREQLDQARNQMLMMQREHTSALDANNKLLAALASKLPANTPLPPALENAGMLPVPVSPAAAYANGSTAPLPRYPGDDM